MRTDKGFAGGKVGISLVSAMGLLAFTCVTVSTAQSTYTELHPHMSVRPADIFGVVLYQDGETPVKNLQVRVWDAIDERTLFRTQTDDDGRFSVPRLGDGRYFLLVGELAVDMRILKSDQLGIEQPHDLVVVIPRRIFFSTPMYYYNSNPLLNMPLLMSPLAIKPPKPPRVASP